MKQKITPTPIYVIKMKKLDYDDILRVSSREDLGYAVSKKLKEIAEEIKELSVWKNVKESEIYAVHILIEVLEPKELIIVKVRLC